VSAESSGVIVHGSKPRAPGRAGRNLPAAIGVGVGLGVIVIGTLLLYKASFLVVVAAFLAIALCELDHAFATREASTPLPLMVVGAAGMQAGAYYGGTRVLMAVFAGTVLASLLLRMTRGQDGFVRDVTATVFCLVYVPLLAGFVALLLAHRHGAREVLIFVLLTSASDIGGYAVGATLGRHPMAPTISPKKSWEGFAGSAATCILVGILGVTLLLHGAWWVGLVLGAAAVVTATFGDLAESMIKRDLGIKDMSNLLPGHGGVMDRLDSLLATVPVVWLVLTFVLPAS
jgi:phosphatidate cytidylyltransferase